MGNLNKDTSKTKKNDGLFQHKFTNTEAAKYLGISPNTLNVWRCKKSFSIAYYKIGSRVYYDQSDLDGFLLSRRIAG